MIELVRRIAITIGALLIFRLGSHIPLAGISTQIGVLSSGAIGIERISIFALTLVPYLSAAIIVQLVSVVWGRLGALERSGEAGRRKIARITLILTLLLASFQAFGIAAAMQNISALVPEPGAWFLLSATASMVGGVFFMVWLSEQITRHGIGNGIALVLSVSVLVSLPSEVASVLELERQGQVSGNLALLNAMLWVVLVAMMVLIEGARRNVQVQYAARQVGKRLFAPRESVLPIKINSAGYLIPVTVMPWLLFVPLALATFIFGRTQWLAAAYEHLQFGRPGHIILGVIVVFVLAFIYTAYVLDPERAAETLQKQGGTIPGVEPGEASADYLDRIVSLTTVVGAVYLVIVSLIPEALVAGGVALPYKIGGGSVLIMVCTILDLKKQVRALSLTDPGGVRQ
jgi:preprotein translocase subunit SecY